MGTLRSAAIAVYAQVQRLDRQDLWVPGVFTTKDTARAQVGPAVRSALRRTSLGTGVLIAVFVVNPETKTGLGEGGQ